MRKLLRLSIPVIVSLCAGSAGAFVIVPVADEPGRFVVVIESALGEHVPLAMLPPPYNRLDGAVWSQGGIVFEWDYFRSPEKGRAEIGFDEAGRGFMSFQFASERLSDGDTIAAAAVLVDSRDQPVLTLYAAARVAGDRFEAGDRLYRSSASFDIAPAELGDVAGLIFFTPKYYAIRKLGEDGVAAAMRRVVARVTGGGGEERWAEPAAD